MVNINVTSVAEQEILNTLKNYVPKKPNHDKLVGMCLRLVNMEPTVVYVTHFLGKQIHICGDSLEIGVCLIPHAFSEFNGSLIDWNGNKFIVTRLS
jgi:hypothetical protein